MKSKLARKRSLHPASVGRGHGGFSLMELLVVLAILALLGGLVGPQLLGAFSGAKTKAAGVQINDFESSLEMYKLDVGRFPSTEEGLQALVVKPSGAAGWNGPYLRRPRVPLDPWGFEYQYKYPGDRGEIDIFTLGQDNQAGGEGENSDVGNWQ
ncbi:MAG: type II secretion system major pseudopilin GspG [Pseudomonadota bacterium]